MPTCFPVSGMNQNCVHLTKEASFSFAGKSSKECECVCSTNKLHDIPFSLVKLALDRVDRVDTLETFSYPYYYDPIHVLNMAPYVNYATPISDQLVESLSHSTTLYGNLLCINHISQ